jgi:hypothetical protein
MQEKKRVGIITIIGATLSGYIFLLRLWIGSLLKMSGAILSFSFLFIFIFALIVSFLFVKGLPIQVLVAELFLVLLSYMIFSYFLNKQKEAKIGVLSMILIIAGLLAILSLFQSNTILLFYVLIFIGMWYRNKWALKIFNSWLIFISFLLLFRILSFPTALDLMFIIPLMVNIIILAIINKSHDFLEQFGLKDIIRRTEIKVILLMSIMVSIIPYFWDLNIIIFMSVLLSIIVIAKELFTKKTS